MKFLHISDLHFGRTLSDFDLYEDQNHLIGRILEAADEHQVDALLIAGDVYDRANPGDGAMNLLDSLLSRASEHNLRTFLISGNHDSDDKLNFGRAFFESREVFIYSRFDGTLHEVTLSDEYGPLHVYLLPFVKASQVRHFYPDARIDTYEDAVRLVIGQSGVNPEERNVLIAHQFVAGTGDVSEESKNQEEPSAENENREAEPVRFDPVLGGSESAAVRAVGNVEKIGSRIFDAFDYTALGHIHTAQRVGRDTVRYSGSPMKYSLSEVNDRKSMVLVTIKEKGAVETELLPIPPLRDLRHLRGTMEQLLRKENIQDPDDFIYVTLTDENLIEDAIGIFREYYPNIVKIDYDNSHTHDSEASVEELFDERISFEDLIAGFYRQMYGTEISEEERSVLKDAAKEAGIIDETS